MRAHLCVCVRVRVRVCVFGWVRVHIHIHTQIVYIHFLRNMLFNGYTSVHKKNKMKEKGLLGNISFHAYTYKHGTGGGAGGI